MKTQPITYGFHIMLVGTTGSGKTHALKYLLNQTEGEIHILDPHAAPDDWPRNCEVHGAGRNFIEIKNVLQQASRELGNRYQARAEGTKEFPRLTIALDELPSICTEIEEAKTIFSQIAREGRKVNIFLSMATQSDRVKTLNIAGEGDVRENFAKITMPKPTPNFKGNHKTALLEIGDQKRKINIPKNILSTTKTQTQNTLKEATDDSEEKLSEKQNNLDIKEVAKNIYAGLEPKNKNFYAVKKAWQLWCTGIGTAATALIMTEKTLKSKK